MRKLLIIAPGILMLAACASSANVPPKVSWGYGPTNNTGVKFPGPQTKYSYNYGVGKDVPVTSGGQPVESYSYGAESTKGDMIQMTPLAKQQIAQPAPVPDPNTRS